MKLQTNPLSPLGVVERMAPSELRALQLKRLKEQLCRVQATSPFYHTLFKRTGFSPDGVNSLNDFFERAPMITKPELLEDQRTTPPFGSRLCADEGSIARWDVTSGTSGLGQEVYGLTDSDIETVGSMGAWLLALQGIRRGDRVAVTLPLGYLQGPWGGQWGGHALGCSVLHLGLAPDSETKLRYMARFGINALYTPTPTYLMRLTRVAEEIGLDPRRDTPQLSVALVVGEAYPLEWAERVAEFWNIRLCEVYGSTQGNFSGTCEYGVSRDGARGYLHCSDWNNITEVLDPLTGEPVAPGESGEAVITNLVREASPVIRYKTGDRVRLLPDDGCPCGRRTVSLEAGTIERLDDMIKLKGMNVWPGALDGILFSSGEVAEYVGEVGLSSAGEELVQLRLTFKADVPATRRSSLCLQLREEVRAITNVSMDVIEVEPGSLPVFEFKARRWTDNRSRDLARATVAGGS